MLACLRQAARQGRGAAILSYLLPIGFSLIEEISLTKEKSPIGQQWYKSELPKYRSPVLNLWPPFSSPHDTVNVTYSLIAGC